MPALSPTGSGLVCFLANTYSSSFLLLTSLIGNTRVIAQDALQNFREAMAVKASDPYQVLLKTNKLPMSLLNEPTGPGGKQHAAKIHVESQPFASTFGPKAQRKRPKISVSDIQDLVGESARMEKEYEDFLEKQRLLSGKSGEVEAEGDNITTEGWIQEAREPIFTKGQSKRIWNELYKVINPHPQLSTLLLTSA